MGVSRFPNGISFVLPNTYATRTDSFTLGAGDTTPDVSQGSFFIAGDEAVTITTFDSGQRGQIIHILSKSGSLTTLSSAGDLQFTNMVINISADILKQTSTGGDIVMLENEVVSFLNLDDTNWLQLGTRIVDTTQV